MKLVFFLLFAISLHANKLLVLIIASDNHPVYERLQNIWRFYMYLDQKNVEAYFIRGDEKLLTPYAIEGDTLWVKTSEGLNPGILNKTILSMEVFLPRIKEFDYILRTNLSSFYIFPRLLNQLKTFPKTGLYSAVPLIVSQFNGQFVGSGSGFILSPDLMELIVAHKHQLLNQQVADDVTLGLFLNHYGASLLPSRMYCFQSFEEWEKNKDQIPENIYQIRVKSTWDSSRSEEPLIMSKLVEMFY